MRYFKLNPIAIIIASSLAFSSMAHAIEVDSGSTVDINSGGLTGEIIVHGGGVLNVNAGASTEGTQIKGTENIQNGAASYYADIQSGGVQNVSGVADNANVGDGGRQIVKDGGKTSGTVLQNNAMQDINAGGYADGSIIYAGGEQYIFEGGVADNTMVEGGGVEIYGGSANYTIVNSGALYVHEGIANNTTVNGSGEISVSGSGISDNTFLYGNSVFSVRDNSSAINTEINDSASMYVYNNAIVSGTIINGGKQEIFSSDSMPTVTDTTINDGAQFVHVNTIVEDTTVNGGNQFVYGTTTDTTINGGMSTIYNGGLADGLTKINADGKMMMIAGSHATDVETNGGTLIVSAPYYGITGVSAAQVDSLSMNGGNVVFEAGMNAGAREGDSSSYSQLNIGELTGTGNFVFNTSLADGVGNFVTINHGSGRFGVTVNDSGKEISDHTDLTVNLINDQDGDIDFILMSTRGGTARAVDGGAYMYVLKQETGKDGLDGNVWHLGAMTEEENGGGNNGGAGLVTTPSTDAVLSLANAGLNIMRGEMDGLRAARASESRGRQHGEGNVWGHYLGKKSIAETSNGTAYKLYQNGMELGGDVVTDLYNSQLVTGGFVSLTSNNVKHARGGTSSVDSYGIGAYATWYDNSGFYLDGMLKANRLESKLNAQMTNGDMTSGKWHQYGLSAALEAGYTLTLMASLTVEPFVRVTGTTINDANVKLNNGMAAKTGKARSLTTEAGSRAATDFSLGNTAFRPYLSISIEQELAHSNEAMINDVNRFKNHQNGTSGKYGAGITVNPVKDVTLYGELNYRQGSYVEEPVQGVAGIRVSF
ncbi:autotransporter outer membrane beta-barrel domain-containing protein [Kluyvera sichuanensis]|uniref:autotransporter outer membrane beta-barrel domain-containing protein n=1 Tax=Kluyvera sichuanensis TaxID=2725494 RepID=UPI0039F45776